MKYVYIFIVLMFGEYVFAQSGVIAHRGFWRRTDLLRIVLQLC